ncbi:MAG TPA: TonB-dependent receptor [Candidatus Hydrogenedentes bacterium]|nr:TonB-dependent receptor [Candidatus Hydrogenedentota bacterium]
MKKHIADGTQAPFIMKPRYSTSVLSCLCLFMFMMSFLLPGNAYGQKTDLDTMLNLSLEELANLPVTTPAKKSQKRSETPATVRIITAKDIEERGYLTLEEALADLPGIQFRNIVGFNSYVFMRGIPNQNNLILLMVDGVQMNELNSGGFYGGGQYNLANVERIEVVYGPASALYGTHAVSGVINIITKAPKDVQGLRVSSLTGNHKTLQHDLIYGYFNEKHDFGFSLSGMFKKSDKADLRGAKGDYNWSDSMDNFEDDFALDAKAQYKSFTIGLNFQDKQASRATKEKTIGTPLQDHGIDWHIHFLNAYAKYDYEKPKNWSLHSMAYFRDTTVEDDTRPVIRWGWDANGGYQERWYRPNYLLGVENRVNISIGKKLSLALGVVYEHEWLSAGYSKSRSHSPFDNAPKPEDPDLLMSNLGSFYTQLEWRMIDSLAMTVGARYDYSDVYGSVLTPRLGLVFNKEKFTAKLLYTEAYRAPKIWDFQDGLGNPGLTSEEMRSLELVLGYSFTEHWRVELSVYRNVLRNCITREENASGWRWVNRGRVNTNGVESTIEYRIGKWKTYLNYTYTDSGDENGEMVPEISPHTANAGVQYAFTDHLRLDLRGQYLGKRRNTHEIGFSGDRWIDDAFILHGTLSYLDYHGFDFQLAAKNMLNEKYYHPSDTSVSRYRQPQFTIMFKVVKRFSLAPVYAKISDKVRKQ